MKKKVKEIQQIQNKNENPPIEIEREKKKEIYVHTTHTQKPTNKRKGKHLYPQKN